MKHLIIAGACAATLLGLHSPALAATPAGPPPLDSLVKPLGLTAEQQRELRPAFAEAEKRAARDREARESSRKPAKEVESELLTRQADLRTRLAAVLTTEQMAEYERLTGADSAHARTTTPHPAHGHHDMSTQPAVRERSEATTAPGN